MLLPVDEKCVGVVDFVKHSAFLFTVFLFKLMFIQLENHYGFVYPFECFYLLTFFC